MPVSKQSVSLPSPILDALRLRDESNLSGAITRSLTRYFVLLAYERRDLRSQYSDKECSLILDACNGSAFFDAFSIRMLPAGVEDAIRFDKLDRKWGVDGPALVAKLQATTFSQRIALVDAVQRWWTLTTKPGESPQYGALLAESEPDTDIGLVF